MAEPATTAPATPAAPAPAAATTPAAAPAQAAAVEAKADAAQAAVETATKQPGETPADFELRLSKLTREARIAREAESRLKGVNASQAKELETLRAELAKAKSKRISKSQYIEMSKAMAADPNKVRDFLDDDSNQIPDAVRERLEKLESQLRSKEEAEEKRNQDANVQREQGIIAGNLEKWSDDFPLLSGNKLAPEHLRQLWHSQWEDMGRTQELKPDLRELVSELHGNLAKTVASALQSPKARQFLARAVPELGALLREQEASASGPGSDAQGAAGSNGRSGTSTASRPDPSKLSEAEKRELRMAALREAQDARRS
jgi:flagellar biosynthesis GTPase FlhF